MSRGRVRPAADSLSAPRDAAIPAAGPWIGKALEHRVKLSLSNCDKLKLKADFAHVRQNGRKTASSLMVALLAAAPDAKLRCGVVCGRKFSLKAVERNRARRLLWESFRLLKPQIAPCHMILIPRNRLLECKTQDSLSQLRRLLKDAGLLSKEQDAPK